MKTLNIFTRFILLVTATLISVFANATPTIDSITVQGYMRNATGTAVTNNTYNIAFMVVQGGGVPVWGKEYSVQVTNGLFAVTLSGAGQDLTAGLAWAHCTGEADFSGVAALNSAALIGGAAGSTVVRVCSRSVIDLQQPEFDITVAAAPTAMVADTAYGVVDGSLLLADFAAGETVAAGGVGASANKIPLLNGTGYIPDSMINPSINPTGAVVIGGAAGTSVTIGSGSGAVTVGGAGNSGVTIGSGSGTVAVGGNGNATVNVGGTGMTTLDLGSSATGALTTTLGSTAGASTTTVQGGSGGVSISSASGTINVGGNGNTTVNVGGTGLTTMNLGSAATGALTSTVGGNAGASATTVRSGTGGTTISSTGTSATAVNITATGVGGGITLSPEATAMTVVNNAKIAPMVFNYVAAGAAALAPLGASVVMVTDITAATTISTITGCNSGVYAQGQMLTIVTTGYTSNSLIIADSTIGNGLIDTITLAAATTNLTLTTNAASRGSSVTLMCTTIGGATKKWVEIARTLNTT